MDFNTNSARAIAAMIALNAGLLVSHHAPRIALHSPAVWAGVSADSAEICKAQAEAHKAALQARLQARTAVREMMQARRQVRQDVSRAAIMAPMAANAKVHNSITDYVHCLLSSGVRSITSGR